ALGTLTNTPDLASGPTRSMLYTDEKSSTCHGCTTSSPWPDKNPWSSTHSAIAILAVSSELILVLGSVQSRLAGLRENEHGLPRLPSKSGHAQRKVVDELKAGQ
ncbi:uncharacterized protein METZ01_LOCUS514258, partial [marine metagenome]